MVASKGDDETLTVHSNGAAARKRDKPSASKSGKDSSGVASKKPAPMAGRVMHKTSKETPEAEQIRCIEAVLDK